MRLQSYSCIHAGARRRRRHFLLGLCEGGLLPGLAGLRLSGLLAGIADDDETWSGLLGWLLVLVAPGLILFPVAAVAAAAVVTSCSGKTVTVAYAPPFAISTP